MKYSDVFKPREDERLEDKLPSYEEDFKKKYPFKPILEVIDIYGRKEEVELEKIVDLRAKEIMNSYLKELEDRKKNTN